MKLRFDEATHTYFLGDVEIPSVTQILKTAGFINTAFYSAQAAARGVTVHAVTEAMDKGVEPVVMVDQNNQGFVDAFERFRKESGFVPILIENRVYHSELRYAGTLDRIGFFPGNRLAIIDLKTGSVPAWAGLQMIGYLDALLYEAKTNRKLGKIVGDASIYTTGRYALRLDEGGTYRLNQFENAVTDYNIWKAAVVCAHWIRANCQHGKDDNE